jgi:hypothetical protein
MKKAFPDDLGRAFFCGSYIFWQTKVKIFPKYTHFRLGYLSANPQKQT